MFQPKVPIVVFDFETSGLDAIKCQPIEICVKTIYPTGDVLLYHKLVRMEADEPLHERITELTGITDEILKVEGVPYKEAAQGMIDFIFSGNDNPYLVGHNFIKFDIRFLDELCRRAKFQHKWKDNGWDTAGHYKAKGCNIKRFENEGLLRWHHRALNTPVKGFFFKLIKCCEEAGISMDGAHRADADVEMTFQLFLHQYGKSIDKPELLAEYKEHQFLQSEKISKPHKSNEQENTNTGPGNQAVHGIKENKEIGFAAGAGAEGLQSEPSNPIPMAESSGTNELPAEPIGS